MGMAADGAGKRSVLDNLKAEEALDVLHRLLATHPDMKKEVESIARSLLGEVSFEEIAYEIEAAVSAFDLDDLNGRAGNHEWGYVGPDEAASDILEEAVEPFIADIGRHVELGMEAEALELCKGVVLGLHRVRQSGGGLVAEWAPDFPAEAAGNAIQAWLGPGEGADKSGPKRKVRKRLAFPKEFVEKEVPEWAEKIERMVEGRKAWRARSL